ncbi:MAG: type II toxin-antitoxin system VapC family toxin [Alphaproteobacteria bacterium]|nr:type II toxin-antitoxin system VapC family toxin [Alphaproteobacteria bacterium]
MSRYMLDTNMCIYLMKNQPEEVAQRFAQCRLGDVVMSAITYAELEYGVTVSADPDRDRALLTTLVTDIPVVAFDALAGNACAPIRLATRERKSDALDKLIAAHAVALGMTIVTNNTRDFASYPGVVTENWLTSPIH